MRKRFAALVLVATVSACARLSGPPTSSFSVFFPPYSAELDQDAQTAIHNAAAFAKSRPSEPVILIGYSAPPDPGKDVPGLSEQRAQAVKAVLVSDGINPNRISAIAKGITDPKANMPELSVRRVDISVGALPPG
ncbi:MAG: OmpA family protein [Acetobacteraceae bacterium]